MTNPDQYRRAPIPADGRTIEAMRLALLDTPAGRAMTNAGDTRLYWMNESDANLLMSPFGIESPFINTPDAVARLVEAARAEADKAMRKFPQPNYVISKLAEEAGEVVKAAIHCAEGREKPENVRAEIVQAMAMLIRLYVEGDQVHGLPALAAMETSHAS